ncbi:Bug family tripartite tricarboxylate transporter substrate binding protein [Rhizobium leguminosarum]|uniref:Bug family tripartite tricarboxylate transporter substrate binding protein n=1 Tax=Rhizobium leguminosarum TaxID=384 RepID=UPI003ED08CF1
MRIPPRTRIIASSLAMLGLIAAAEAPVSAQEFPDRAIEIIVPLSAGGVSDIAVRKLAPSMSKTLGAPVVIENQPGAGATLGTGAAAKATPDGYTVALAAASSFSINPHLRKNLPYDPVKSFEPVCRIGGSPSVLVAHPSLGVKSVQELIEKAKDGNLSFASSGPGTPSHLAQELLKARTNVQFLHVPYRGTSQSVTDAIGGHVQLLFESPGAISGAVRTKELIGLGILSPKRLPALPDVPTFEELGFEGMELIGWIGLVVPAGTPTEVIDKLEKACHDAVSSPDFQKLADEQGLLVAYAPREEFRKHIASELSKWGELVQRSGLKPE